MNREQREQFLLAVRLSAALAGGAGGREPRQWRRVTVDPARPHLIE